MKFPIETQASSFSVCASVSPQALASVNVTMNPVGFFIFFLLFFSCHAESLIKGEQKGAASSYMPVINESAAL